jgi:transcriptional regulator with XRE-family HTH domain
MPRIKRGGPPPSDNSYQAVGKRMKALRLAFGKTQTEIAAIVGVSTGMISNCENGGARLSADHMIKLLIEFDAPLDWLYLGWKRHLSNELRRKLDQVDPDLSQPADS